MGVVGIGRIGLPLAAVLSKHYETVGVDVDRNVVDRVRNQSEFAEPLLNDYIRNYKLEATTDFSRLRSCQTIFICVGSQMPGEGYSSDRFLSALRATIPQLVSKDQVLVITTTLPPSDFKTRVMALLRDERLEDRIGGVCYNPAMVALGKVVADFESPPYMLIGETSSAAGAKVEALWRKVVGASTRIFHAGILDVAVAKYALNVALVSKISLLSYLTEFCEKEDSDIDLIANILRAEPRVAGEKMFKGGLGYGGTCFPVDIEAVKFEGEKLGIPGTYPDALTALNDWQVKRSLSLIRSLAPKRVGILGLSFKQDTDVIAASQSLEIAKVLAREYQVTVYDPRAMKSAKGVLGKTVVYATDLKAAVTQSDVVFIGVEWSEFRQLERHEFRSDQVVVDPWRVLRANPPSCRYYPYGKGTFSSRSGLT